MFVALNMELDIVRTVLNNEINDIYVCTDLKNGTGVFYTMISIKSANFRKLIAERMQTSGLFFGNKDYMGSFVFVNQLNLVFRYYHENLLSMMGSVYLYSFPDCKRQVVMVAVEFVRRNQRFHPDNGWFLVRYFNTYGSLAGYRSNDSNAQCRKAQGNIIFEVFDFRNPDTRRRNYFV